jgi:hypothetical protein
LPAVPPNRQVLEDLSILHDDEKVLVWIFDEVNVLKRIAVNQQLVSECTFFDDPACRDKDC